MEHEWIQIVSLLNTDCLKKIEENRKTLKPLVHAVTVLGRQGITFTGHWEQGKITINDDFDGTHEGKFRAILSYRVEGDECLRKYFKSERKQKYFRSPNSKWNNKSMLHDTYKTSLYKIRAALFLSLLADEIRQQSRYNLYTLFRFWYPKCVWKFFKICSDTIHYRTEYRALNFAVFKRFQCRLHVSRW